AGGEVARPKAVRREAADDGGAAEEAVHQRHARSAPTGDVAALRAHHADEVAAERLVVTYVLGGAQESHVAAQSRDVLAKLRVDAVGRQLVVVERVVGDGVAGGGDELPAGGGGLLHRQRDDSAGGARI